MKAAGAGRRSAVRRVFWFLLLDIVGFATRLIPNQPDVRGGRSWCPVPLGRRSQMLELPLLLAPTEWTAS